MGTQSRGLFEVCSNGGEALALIAKHYFGNAGAIILAVTVTFACLKTAVGLITSCSETFVGMFPNSLSYKTYAVVFCLISFAIANFGLSSIISISLPVLMFLYPMAITLILLSLFSKFYNNNVYIFRFVTGFTAFAAFFDFMNALPDNIKSMLHLGEILEKASVIFPFFNFGMGWVCPAVIGVIAGLIATIVLKKR